MTTFLDIGAVRIQSWLLRTPRLRLLRGASAALKALTSTDTTKSQLNAWGFQTVAQVTPEAGDKDGVISLTVSDASAAPALARSFLAELHAQLPGLEWVAWWCEADSYLDALQLERAPSASVSRMRVVPATYDVPILRQCSSCRAEAALVGTPPHLPGDEEELKVLGRDCWTRNDSAFAQKDGWDEEVPGRWPKDADELARRGGLGPDAAPAVVGRKDSRNHLATICADGNRIGDLFTQLNSFAADVPTLAQYAVTDLTEFTRQAVVDAANASASSQATVMGVIPHLIGGDDVFVSVPAPSAWTFVAELSRSFGQLRDRWNGYVDRDLGSSLGDPQFRELRTAINQVSLGIGVAFAHSSHPIAETHELASRAERAAKKSTMGRASAVAWVDLTAGALADAVLAGSWVQVLGCDELRGELQPGLSTTTEVETLTGWVVGLNPSARAQLMMITRDAPTAAALADAVKLWVRRTRDDDPHNGKVLELEHLLTKERLLPILSRARWWPVQKEAMK